MRYLHLLGFLAYPVLLSIVVFLILLPNNSKLILLSLHLSCYVFWEMTSMQTLSMLIL